MSINASFVRHGFLALAVVALSLAPRAESKAANEPRRIVRTAPAPGPAASGRATSRARTDEERAILAVREHGIRRVESLALRIRATPDEGARRPLELDVRNIKFESRLAELRVMSDFAQRRGDVARTQQVAEQIDLMLHPRPHVVAPLSSKPVAEKGGRP